MDTLPGDQAKSNRDESQEAQASNLSFQFEEFLKQHQLRQQQNPENVDESSLKPSLNRNKECMNFLKILYNMRVK